MHERQMCLYSKQERGETVECCRAMPRDPQRLPGGCSARSATLKHKRRLGADGGWGASMRAQEYMFVQLSANTPVRSQTPTLAANHPLFFLFVRNRRAQRICHLSTPAVICESIQ